ncbi:MAG: LamG domain-containing protein, partial [Planctomycetia bacterium]|nr:LamG domain-containing protein [Planctomycetia bacterium]
YIYIYMIFVISSPAHGERVGEWLLDGNAEMAAGSGHSGLWATLGDGTQAGKIAPRYTFDGLFGRKVYDFHGQTTDDKSCIYLGNFPTITATATDNSISDFTISAWVLCETTPNTYSNGKQGIIWGARYPDDADGYNFMKLMIATSSYNTGDSSAGLSVPRSENEWHYISITKSGSTMTAYVDGVQTGTNSGARGQMNPLLFGLGGDVQNARNGYTTSEEFSSGKLSEFRIDNNAMTAQQAKIAYYTAKNTLANAFRVPSQTTTIVDNFDADTLHSRWTKDLTTGYGGGNVSEGYFTADVQDGLLVLSGGNTGEEHWRGGAVVSDKGTTYTASEANEVVVSVDRMFVERSGTSPQARAALILTPEGATNWKNGTNYFMFSDVESSGSWGYNDNSSAGSDPYIYHEDGTRTLNGFRTGYLENANMAIKHDGTYASLYVNGELITRRAIGFDEFYVSLGAFSREKDTTSTVSFDNLAVAQRNATTVPVSNATLRDTFDGETIQGWQTSGNVTQGYGVLQMRGDATANALLQPIASQADFTVSVDRDSMKNTVGTTAGLKLFSDDAWLSIFQENTALGSSWGIAWENLNMRLQVDEDTLFTGTSGNELILPSDVLKHQILLESLWLEEENVMEMTLSIDDLTYSFRIEDWDAALYAQLFSTGTGAYAGFDNFRLSGTDVPEPTTWGLLLLGGILLGFQKFRQKFSCA